MISKKRNKDGLDLKRSDPRLIEFLKNGKIGVLPTDTIYGLVATALNPSAINRLYQIKGRHSQKPFIILISAIADLDMFRIAASDKQKTTKYWPGPVSLILPCPKPNFKYLHRGHKSLAFRMPADTKLHQLLSQTGPLAAPSANPENKPPATSIAEAKSYFGNGADFYVDAGKLKAKPSSLISLLGRKPKVLRN